ncbi:glycosyltransferase [Helicobacter pullorum]|uniref:glycosyltransferase n=1 Tax=Helicobacter pullorum TaxID=35818 RepID=UPI000CF0ADE7|nr:glycosyltransferase [Helicobacter pullorum]
MSVKISILTPSFNHEKCIRFFLQSVLGQTFQNFELIIVDDCSWDKNLEEIKKFKDERIKLIRHDYNKGINATLNTAFENSSGEILVFCASDDMLERDALEKIYQAFEETHIDVVYPGVKVIDENNVISQSKKIEMRYKEPLEILNYMFFEGNCLMSVGMSIKRQVFRDIYPLPLGLCNHQDTFMHINLLLNGAKILFLQDEVILYRMVGDQTSISARKDVTLTRENLEIESLMDSFLRVKDIELLKKIFKNEIHNTGIMPYEDTIKFFLGRMALDSPYRARQDWGYHKILEFYNDAINVKKLKERYNFVFKDYLGLACSVKDDKVMRKYQKYKKYFKVSMMLIMVLLIIVVLLGVKNA